MQVKHAAQGDLGGVAEDAMRMAQAGARGAAESTRLVFETVTGLSPADISSSPNSKGRQGAAAEVDSEQLGCLCRLAAAASSQLASPQKHPSSPNSMIWFGVVQAVQRLPPPLAWRTLPLVPQTAWLRGPLLPTGR